MAGGALDDRRVDPAIRAEPRHVPSDPPRRPSGVDQQDPPVSGGGGSFGQVPHRLRRRRRSTA